MRKSGPIPMNCIYYTTAYISKLQDTITHLMNKVE